MSSAKSGVRTQVGDNANKPDSSFLPSLAAISPHPRHPESLQSMRYARFTPGPAQALSYTRRTGRWVWEGRTAATAHQTAISRNARIHIEPPHPYGVHFLRPFGASSGVCAARYFGREVIRRRPPWGRGPSQGPPKSFGNGWRLTSVIEHLVWSIYSLHSLPNLIKCLIHALRAKFWCMILCDSSAWMRKEVLHGRQVLSIRIASIHCKTGCDTMMMMAWDDKSCRRI